MAHLQLAQEVLSIGGPWRQLHIADRLPARAAAKVYAPLVELRQSRGARRRVWVGRAGQKLLLRHGLCFAAPST